MMKWTHLPNAGGIYDQHPKFMDDLVRISQIEARAEAAKQKKQQAEQNRKRPAAGRRSAGRRR
jgi:hypothetical protein